MKKQPCLTLAILFTFCFLACKKEKNIEPIDLAPTIAGIAQSMYNGVFWKFEIGVWKNIGYPGRFNLTFNHYNEYRERRGEFNVSNITLNADTVYYLTGWVFSNGNIDTLKQFCDFTQLYNDGDVAGDSYVPLNDSSMVFTVDQIDMGNHISGRFWGKMVKKIGEMEIDPTSPDTITFSEGTYEVKLE